MREKKEEYPLEYFKNHELTIIHESKEVKRYQYMQPDTGCYGFSLTCADNLIVMNGDCYTFIAEPGYGRCGLAFLRGSVKSVSYLLSKCPLRKELTEYKYEHALEDMENDLKSGYGDDYEESGKEIFEEFKDGLSDEDGSYGEMKYWELCSSLDIDEPPYATRMTSTTKMQIAGLMCFVEAYNKMDKVFKELVDGKWDKMKKGAEND